MGNSDCGCTGRNAVLVINTAIKNNYRPIQIALTPNIDLFAYYTRINIQFCFNNLIGPFFIEKPLTNPNQNEETNELLNELIAITDFDKYIQTKTEVSVLEYEEFYSNGKIDAIKAIPIDKLKQHVLLNRSSLFRVPLYLALLTHYRYVSYSKKHISIQKNTKTKHQIEVDLPRTFPKIRVLTLEPFQFNFRSLLYEIAGRDKRISYVQGMNFIGALCLLLSGNQLETALILFAKILSLESSLFKMTYKDCFNHGFPLLIKYLDKAKELLMKYHRSVYDKIIDYDVNEHTWLSKWILTLFLAQFEIEIALKFWDVLISEGIDSILVICLTIVEIYKEDLQKAESLIEFSNIICHEMVIESKKAELLIQKLVQNISTNAYELT